jgi:hypothetical protein
MPTVSNKTQRPLFVPLPRGKTLHPSPGKTGEIAWKAVEHPPLKKLVEAGEIEIHDDERRQTGEAGGGRRGGRTYIGHGSGVSRRGGDR